MPNLGELFLPRHPAGGSGTTEVVGNRELESESSHEASATWYGRIGPVENEVRGSVINVRTPILPATAPAFPTPTVRPVNSPGQTLSILEDRAKITASIWGVGIQLAGGIEVAGGDRDGYFEGVPEYRAIGTLSIGRSLFSDTSDILVTGEYQHTGRRQAQRGTELSSYRVVNVKLSARLVDAQLYLLWLNYLDEEYETSSPYLMTPRTFVYGVAWTFSN